MRHLPLGELFNGVLAAGLAITRVLEPGERSLPYALAFSADRLEV